MNFLESVGLVALCMVVIVIVVSIYSILRELLNNAIIKHKIKKRFKKPPTAACYCRDCKKWEPETGKCWDACNSRLMGAEWFCCFAEPLTGELFKAREKQFKEGGTK